MNAGSQQTLRPLIFQTVSDLLTKLLSTGIELVAVVTVMIYTSMKQAMSNILPNISMPEIG